jgi:Ser/Thr protein kinase RdoA (MazF antagonist)
MDHIAALEAWESVVGSTYDLEPMPVVHNEIWRVEANERVFVLRRLPEYPPGAGPVEAFRVLGHLQAAGVPVAPPIITDTGAIRAPVGERFYELLPYVPNDPVNHELGPHAGQTSYAIGAAIAQFDLALADCPWPVTSFVEDPPRDILDETLPKLPEIAELVAPLVPRLRDATSGLPAQRSHGDCNSGNVLVHKGKVSGFIDVDHLPTGPRVRDLAYYMESRLSDQLSEHEAEPPVVAVLGDYVAGFHEATPLSEQELEAIAPLMLLVAIGGASWCRYGWTPNPEGYAQNIRAIEWITEHYEELVHRVSAASGDGIQSG